VLEAMHTGLAINLPQFQVVFLVKFLLKLAISQQTLDSKLTVVKVAVHCCDNNVQDDLN